MLGRIGRDASSPLAVQIAPDSIRILQLSGRRVQPRVSAWALEPLEQRAAALRVDGSLESLAAPLCRALEQCGSRQRQAVLALPAAQVMCKRCCLPAGLNDDALEQQVLAQAEQLFPVTLDDLALDFQVLGPAATPGQVEVLVAACRQHMLDPLEALCAAVGLELVALEVDSLALQRVMPATSGACAALLELEAGSTVLHSWPDAATALQQHLVNASGDAHDTGWLPALGRLLCVATPDQQVRALFITGALATATFAQHLQVALGLPCQMLPALDGLHLDHAARKAQAGCMALPYSLALGGLR
ncbi:pilus assembly protein PilM [Pseudomonas sp. RP23018S]|uniref:type IV pilus biogenesis protein PilM n=1 Tax=Pseudomonas sp. RP23018S TaxID=3096037 RepID=UPI002ACA7776|nr:pilus assembly protein PilM [Pseudomonas sp. RP23018S]MDZ5603970.1 pilus assembly protein PilM [Pseudomonas sp. RP23018S]